jgi:threonine dehydrogenase-like Zn-dependent dehydrogenase
MLAASGGRLREYASGPGLDAAIDVQRFLQEGVTMDVEDITRVAVVGAGLMGHGIALQFALGGYDVMLNDVSEEKLEQALGNVQTNLALLQGMGLVDERAAANSHGHVDGGNGGRG